jgi:hypothetical protein
VKKLWIIVFFLLTSCMPRATPTNQAVSSSTPVPETNSIVTPLSRETDLSAGQIQVDTFEQEIYPYIENGNCSFGEAITASNTLEPVDACAAGAEKGSTINLQPGLYSIVSSDPSTVHFPNGELWERKPQEMAGLPVITRQVKINGNGAIITGGYNILPRILITLADDIVINDLILNGGGMSSSNIDATDYFAGGIYWHKEGHAVLNNVRIENGTADYGGGIANNGTLELNNCIIRGGIAYRQGGGIHNSGVMRIVDSFIEVNTAREGGGMALAGTGNTTIIDSDIDHNRTILGSGGGILIDPKQGLVKLLIQDSRITENEANIGAGGGLAFLYDYNSGWSIESRADPQDYAEVTLVNTVVSENTAEAGGGGIAWAEPLEKNILRITQDSKIINNKSMFDFRHGGGILNARGTVVIENSTMEGNRTGNGAGIYNELGILQVMDSVFARNHAYNELEPESPDYGMGAGIFNSGGQVTVANTKFTENQARFGGGIYYAYPGTGDSCEKIESAFTTVANSCFVGKVVASDESGPSIGDEVFADECKEPVIEATQNYWGPTVRPDETAPANVLTVPFLEKAPPFCVQP